MLEKQEREGEAEREGGGIGFVIQSAVQVNLY